MFVAVFAEVPDPRTGNAKRHDLLEVLTIALTASVCGAESCSDFADFAADREGLFREFLRLENGIPSHDTFSRVFRLLDPEAFNRCFGRFIEDLGAAGEGVLAIDGKTLRRSFDRAAKRSPLAVVSAFASASRCVIGQEAFRSGDGHAVGNAGGEVRPRHRAVSAPGPASPAPALPGIRPGRPPCRCAGRGSGPPAPRCAAGCRHGWRECGGWRATRRSLPDGSVKLKTSRSRPRVTDSAKPLHPEDQAHEHRLHPRTTPDPRRGRAAFAPAFGDEYWLARDNGTSSSPRTSARPSPTPASWASPCRRSMAARGLGITEAADPDAGDQPLRRRQWRRLVSVSAGDFRAQPGGALRHGMSRRRACCRRSSAASSRACFGVTEPNTGLDTTRLRTKAVRQGDRYMWCTARRPGRPRPRSPTKSCSSPAPRISARPSGPWTASPCSTPTWTAPSARSAASRRWGGSMSTRTRSSSTAWKSRSRTASARKARASATSCTASTRSAF